MFKRLFCLLLCLTFLLGVGCSKKGADLSVDSADEYVSSVPAEPEYAVNNLTGVKDLDIDAQNNRPVAIMINNIEIAQKVQTGLNKADIVYETEVEGSITRLLAVYKDVSSVEKIGTVRSARYPYIDLAMGHNAIYVHHGQDPNYAKAHLKDCDSYALSEGNSGVRLSNGLKTEHTLYGYGDKLWNNLGKKFKTQTDNISNWQNFAEEGNIVGFTDTAINVTLPLTKINKSVFKYDSEKGKYIRFMGSTQRNDYVTGEPHYIKNVFLLNTTITDYPDGYHRKVALTSGTGYYFVNGTYTKINWSKGNASSPMKFTNLDGTPLTVAQGNSWVCIAQKSVTPIVETPTEQ